MAVLVIVMVAGSLATAWYYLWGMNGSVSPFSGVPDPVIRSYRFANLAGRDGSALDVLNLENILYTFTFDTSTTWPDTSKIPIEATPGSILEKGKYLGLGLNSLHEQGVTGYGVSVAVFDKPIPEEHQAYPENMTYIEVLPDDPGISDAHFHGAACAGILAGQNGVAPKAHLYYFAVPDGPYPYELYSKAMEELLELQMGLPEQERIRVLSVSQGIDPDALIQDLGGARGWFGAIQNAKDQGIITVYPGMSDLDFTGAGAQPTCDRDDPSSYKPWSWSMAKKEVMEELLASKVDSWEGAREQLIKLLTEAPDLDALQAEAIDTFIYTMAYYKDSATFPEWADALSKTPDNTLAIPADYLTLMGIDSAESYTYFGSGGLSWATPYLAGVLALGLQVRPSATSEELYEALNQTVTITSELTLINPEAFVRYLSAQ